MISDLEIAVSLPPNKAMARRLLTWEWSPAFGTADVVASAVKERLRYWQKIYPKNVLHFDVSGSAFGVIQVRAFVQWRTQFKVSMHARTLTEYFAHQLQYPGGMPDMLPVRWRHGGNLRRPDGADADHSDVRESATANS